MLSFIKSRLNKNLIISLIIIAILLLITAQKLVTYIIFDFNFILFLLSLPFIVKADPNKKSIRYAIATILLLAVYPFLKSSSIYFFAFVCTLFFLYEYQFGKLNILPLLLVLVVSPITIFLSNAVGFEIRLILTRVAANILSYINNDYSFSGNIILLDNNEFHVDTECMGLKMVILALFVALIFISYRQKRERKDINSLFIILILSTSYVLVIFANLFRIITITVFKAMPETLSHEIIGIICFIVYVLLPLWYFVKFLFHYFAIENCVKEKKTIDRCKPDSKNSKYTFYLLSLIILVLFSSYELTDIAKKDKISRSKIEINNEFSDFSCSVTEYNVIKMSNDDYLIYIKPVSNFYVEHSPIVCWRGSGYKIVKEQIIQLNNHKVYYGELIKNKDILYTTWWYDCGTNKTISQFNWRYRSLTKSENYSVVNIVSSDKNKLRLKTKELISKNILVL